MQVKILFFAAASVSSVLAGPLNLKAPKRNEPDLILAREGDDLCCYPIIEDLEECHKCQPFEKADSFTVNSYPDEAVSKRAEDGILPPLGFPTYQPLYDLPLITTVKLSIPLSPAKAREATAMVGTSSHSKPQFDPTSTSTSTLSSNTGLAPCTKDGNLVPAKPLLEPWCSAANKRFQCQFCSHTFALLVAPGDPLNEYLTEQDFEIWTVERAVGDTMMTIKDDSYIHSRNDPCCIHGGLPEYNCDYCKGDGKPPSTPHKGTVPAPAITPPLPQPPKRSFNDICCYSNGVQTCYVCGDGQKLPKVAGGNVSVWAQKHALTGDFYRYEKGQDGSGADITESEEQCCVIRDFEPVCRRCPSSTYEPPAPVAKDVHGRDQNDLCCFTNGLEVFSCYLCNKDPHAGVTGEISVWTRKEEIGQGTYEYELVPDGTSGATNDVIQNKCCTRTGYIPICFDCPSAKSATELRPLAATANKLAARDSNDLCCFASRLQVFGCYLCNKTLPVGINTADGEISVWKQGSTVGNDVFDHEEVMDAKSVRFRNSNKKCCSITNDQETVCYKCPSPRNTPPMHLLRQAPTTTKVGAIATQPEPTLSFPTTLPNLPQITPQSTAALGKRGEQRKCCYHYGVVVSCHNCSPEEEDPFDHVPNPPASATQEQCCVHHGDDLVCHGCPVGIANTTEYDELSRALSLVPRQQTYDFHATCNGMYETTGANKLTCPNSKSTISGATCQSACHCDDLGSMQCDAPAGTRCTNDAMTKFCRFGSAYWGCACTHLPDHPHALENTVPH